MEIKGMSEKEGGCSKSRKERGRDEGDRGKRVKVKEGGRRRRRHKRGERGGGKVEDEREGEKEGIWGWGREDGGRKGGGGEEGEGKRQK